VNRRIVPVTEPLDLARTARGVGTWGAAPWLRVDATGVWVAQRTAAGPGTIRLMHEGNELQATAWGPGAPDLLARAERLAGLHDDPSAVAPHHAVVAAALKRARGVRMASVDQVYPTLIATILAQKVTGKESQAATMRLARRWGEPAPGPRDDLWLFPAPRALAQTPVAAFHPLGVERRRAQVLIEAATRIGRLEACVTMRGAQAMAHLQKLPGIGPWTAGVVVGEALGDPDAVPVGDYHLPNVVAFNLAGEPRADDARMLALLAPYAGQRGRVVRLLKSGGQPPPKWGPRSEARDIRGF